MQNLKNIPEDQKHIIENSISILYTCKNESGNFNEKEVIKHNGTFYKITAVNKKLIELIEV